MGEREVEYRVLLAKYEGKGPLGKPRPRREYNTNLDI